MVKEDVVEKPTEKHTGTDIQVIPRVFENNQVTQIMYKGQPVLIAKEVGRALGYAKEGSRLVDSINADWSNEFIYGIDYIKLVGAELVELKRVLKQTTNFVVRPNLNNCILLTQSGVDLVCSKTNKHIGIRLRRWLVDEVLPSLRKTGSYEMDKGKSKTNKQFLSEQRIANTRFSEWRKAANAGANRNEKLIAHCTKMYKNSPTEDKRY